MGVSWIVEASDVVAGDYGPFLWPDREGAERAAREVSRTGSWAGREVFVVVDLGGGDRIGHRVFKGGKVVRTEGLYDE